MLVKNIDNPAMPHTLDLIPFSDARGVQLIHSLYLRENIKDSKAFHRCPISLLVLLPNLLTEDISRNCRSVDNEK
jgi:hypothetical protein